MPRRTRAVVLAAVALVAVLVGVVALTSAGRSTMLSAGPTTASPTTVVVASTAATTTTSTTTSTTTTTRRVDPRPGAADVADPLFPGLGNGGYDVVRYDLDVAADPARPDIDATASIAARALHDLRSFNLDLHGLEVTQVSVDGRAAEFRRDLDELIVTPDAPVTAGREFTTVVRYRGTPQPLPDPDVGRVGWIHDGRLIYVAAEPQGAHTWFPANDHPTDKAAFRVTLNVPPGVSAVSGGLLTERVDGATGSRFVWDMREPTAPYLVSVAIGDLVLSSAEGPHGIVLRNAFAASLAAAATRATARVPEMITVLESLFGPYPFSTYGSLVIDTRLGFALENQTLSLFDRNVANGGSLSERIQVHELAHQWFGDSVSLSTWRDIWLNEGFATYAESLWLERTQPGYDIDAAMRIVASRAWPPIGSPARDALFDDAVYQRGALVLQALRRTIGDDAFFATVRAYAETHRHGNATTADLVAIAERQSGRPVADLVRRWLFDDPQPALP